MSQQKWVIDFEGFQINDNFYPLELCLLNTQRPREDLHIWHIRYTDSLALAYDEKIDRTICWQSNEHGMSWKQGNMPLLDAFLEMRDLFPSRSQHKLYAKGLEKTKWIREWFEKDNNVTVIEIINAPSYRDMNMYYGSLYGHPCAFHRDSPHLRCACRKAQYLCDYIA